MKLEAAIREATGRVDDYEISLIANAITDLRYVDLDNLTREELMDLAVSTERVLEHIGHLESFNR